MSEYAPNVAPADINYRYFIDYVTRNAAGHPGFRVLDFGCGRGEIVRVLREAGIEAYGADVFYEGADYAAVREGELYKAGTLREMQPTGDLPFDAEFFDLIISNQVFEHVADKAAELRRLKRVLKPGGLMRHHFPSKEVVREGHIGIPMAHWMKKGPVRFNYALSLRCLGLGHHKNNLAASEWTARSLDWIDAYCFYEPRRQIERMMEAEGFEVRHDEIDYCRFRAKGRGPLDGLMGIQVLKGFWERMFRRLAFMAVELRVK